MLYVHEFGSPAGYPLLALHGVGGHGGRWRNLAQQQLAGFRVLAPDLRGHGRSEPRPPWTLEQHAADLLSVLDGHGVSAAAVLGHSFGGAVALHLARLAPRRISRLILLDPVVGADPGLALERASYAERVFADPADAAAAQRAEWPTASDAAVLAELEEHLTRGRAGWRFRYVPAAVATAWSEMTRSPVLPNPGTPTLLVPALREAYVREEFVRGCRVVLGADFEVFGLDAGHVLPVERPDDVGRIVTDFVHRG